MPQPHPAHHVLRPAATAAIPRSLPLGRCDDRMRADAVRLSKVAQNGIPQQGTLCYPTPGRPGLKSRIIVQTLPSRSEAVKAIRYLSTRDRREIARIARLVPDEVAAQRGFSPSPTYRGLWTNWLEQKGPDLAIVFE